MPPKKKSTSRAKARTAARARTPSTAQADTPVRLLETSNSVLLQHAQSIVKSGSPVHRGRSASSAAPVISTRSPSQRSTTRGSTGNPRDTTSPHKTASRQSRQHSSGRQDDKDGSAMRATVEEEAHADSGSEDGEEQRFSNVADAARQRSPMDLLSSLSSAADEDENSEGRAVSVSDKSVSTGRKTKRTGETAQATNSATRLTRNNRKTTPAPVAALKSPPPPSRSMPALQGHSHTQTPHLSFFHHYDSMRPLRIRVGVVPLPSGEHLACKRSRTSSPARLDKSRPQREQDSSSSSNNSPLAKWQRGAQDIESPTATAAVPSFASDRQAVMLTDHAVTYVERFLPPRRFFQMSERSDDNVSAFGSEEVVGWAGVFTEIPNVLPGAAPPPPSPSAASSSSSTPSADGHPSSADSNEETHGGARWSGFLSSLKSFLPGIEGRQSGSTDMLLDGAGSITVVLAPNA